MTITMNFNRDFTAAQIEALTACMLSTSNVDGVHPAETELIKQFYEASRDAGMPSFADVGQLHVKAMSLLQRIPADPGFNVTLVSMCLMTGYADGTLSEAERAHVQGFARSVGVSGEDFDGILQTVRDSLLGSLAHLPDAESVATLAKEL